MTTSHCSAISCRRSTGAVLVNVGLRYRRTTAPSAASSSSSRSRTTFPRGLLMSSSPTVRPRRDSGRGQQLPRGGLLLAGRVQDGSHARTSLVTGELPVEPDTQPPTTALNRPASPPACTTSRPPGRNLGSCLPASASGTPSVMPPAPRISSSASRVSRPSISATRRARSQPASRKTRPCSGRDDEHRVERQRQLGVAVDAQAGGERPGQRLRRPAQLVDDGLHAGAGEEGDRVTGDAAVGGQRGERAALLALGEAEGELAGVAQRRAVDPAGAATADVADDELHRPADGGVGAVALPEGVDAAVHADPAGDRAVDDDHRAGEVRRRQEAVQGELLGARRLQGGQHDRQVLGQAAGHHGVDGHLLDGALDQVRGHRRRRRRRVRGSCRAASAAPAPGSAGRRGDRRSSRGRTSPRARPRGRRAPPGGCRGRCRRSAPRGRRCGTGRPTASRSRGGARGGPRPGRRRR